LEWKAQSEASFSAELSRLALDAAEAKARLEEEQASTRREAKEGSALRARVHTMEAAQSSHEAELKALRSALREIRESSLKERICLEDATNEAILHASTEIAKGQSMRAELDHYKGMVERYTRLVATQGERKAHHHKGMGGEGHAAKYLAELGETQLQQAIEEASTARLESERHGEALVAMEQGWIAQRKAFLERESCLESDLKAAKAEAETRQKELKRLVQEGKSHQEELLEREKGLALHGQPMDEDASEALIVTDVPDGRGGGSIASLIGITTPREAPDEEAEALLTQQASPVLSTAPSPEVDATSAEPMAPSAQASDDYIKLELKYRSKQEQYATIHGKLELSDRRCLELHETMREMEWESEALHIRAVDAETAMMQLQTQIKALGAKPNLKRPEPSQDEAEEGILPAPQGGVAPPAAEEAAGIVSSLFGWATPACGAR